MTSWRRGTNDRRPGASPGSHNRSMPTFDELSGALARDSAVAERMFDRLLPFEYQFCSRVHWTPLVAAFRVAAWLDSQGTRTMLDIGAGAGKLCVAAAMGARRCRFVGLERRPHLVTAARELARGFGVADRVEFIEGELGAVALPDSDAYYCFNPFGENIMDPEDWLDDTVDLGPERMSRDIELLELLLERARVGVHLITYYRAGCRLPTSFEQIDSHTDLPNQLRLWQKMRPTSDGWQLERGP
jgi:SAM-dependent methyltransferase